MNREDILKEVLDVLAELTEQDPSSIHGETLLFEELDLDSIDAVDLVVRLQSFTGKKVQPEEFKQMRKVNDVVDSVENLLKME
ncbi:acyl carrier protein [Verrucomicrobia bacterium]|nr:acyl carrier protein [Verrucomicrobiota bacterium]